MTIDEIIKDKLRASGRVILERDQAEAVISALQSAMVWKKYPEERPDRSELHFVKYENGHYSSNVWDGNKWKYCDDIITHFAEIK